MSPFKMSPFRASWILETFFVTTKKSRFEDLSRGFGVLSRGYGVFKSRLGDLSRGFWVEVAVWGV